jgi:hypothetical protein
MSILDSVGKTYTIFVDSNISLVSLDLYMGYKVADGFARAAIYPLFQVSITVASVSLSSVSREVLLN